MTNQAISINNLSNSILNMFIFNKLKTGDPFFDAIITAVMVSSISYLIQLLFNYINKKFDFAKLENIYNYYFNKYSVEYEGKISFSNNIFDCKIYQTSSFGDNFKSLWNFIINNINNNKSIYHIKEYNFNNYSNIINTKNDNLYIVTQTNKFLISKELDIYALTTIRTDTGENEDRDKSKFNLTKISIKLFSNTSDTTIIKQFVDNLTKIYLSNIADLRVNKQFIYTLIKNEFIDNTCEMWKENIFSSTSKFSNIFFKEKNKLINKIDFFLNNKEWYFEKGIPYTLGICLHGPPGTGKTSFIKALGNHTQREIIIISLKLIKTKNQLDTVFFEDRYNLDNKKGSINFSNKIIVFEDIDCIGDIVLDRNRTIIDTNFIEKSLSKEEEISKFLQINKIQENPLTLDDILNLWDGIRETPGRIMCITTNHYNKLDPALIRPGRIDVCMEMSYISYTTMKEMYEHLFQEKIDIDKFYNIKENFYSPAEIISIYMSSERNSIKFIEILEKNQHLNNYTFIK